MKELRIHQEWKALLAPAFSSDYFTELIGFLHTQSQEGNIFYPAENHIFEAFNLCTPSQIKVVILGQDPYHRKDQAHGLSFSVPQGIAIPPSLKNIFKELSTDLGVKQLPTHGDLTHWAKQGVLLLNTSLTVEAGKPMSHSQVGWQFFTHDVLQLIANLPQPIVFFFWGKFAQTKKQLVHRPQHLTLCAAHPSPLSAYHGFFGSRPFSQANRWLINHGVGAIDWDISIKD